MEKKITRMSMAEAREHFADIVNDAVYKNKRTIVTSRGKGVVAIVPLIDIEVLDILEDKNDAILGEQALKEAKIPWH